LHFNQLFVKIGFVSSFPNGPTYCRKTKHRYFLPTW
jgi:hypothetical protein